MGYYKFMVLQLKELFSIINAILEENWDVPFLFSHIQLFIFCYIRYRRLVTVFSPLKFSFLLRAAIRGRQSIFGSDFSSSPNLSMSVSFHLCSILTLVSCDGQTVVPLAAAFLQKHSLIHRNNKNCALSVAHSFLEVTWCRGRDA